MRLLLDLETTFERIVELSREDKSMGVAKRLLLGVQLGCASAVITRLREQVEAGGPLIRDLAVLGNGKTG